MQINKFFTFVLATTLVIFVLFGILLLRNDYGLNGNDYAPSSSMAVET